MVFQRGWIEDTYKKLGAEIKDFLIRPIEISSPSEFEGASKGLLIFSLV